MEKSAQSSVLLIYTGGTIGMKPDPVSGVLVPFDFSNLYDEFPYLYKLNVEIDFLHYRAIDSSNVTPELWIYLATLIRDNYDQYDGFVILHGTDTMAYSASALSFMLENLEKPVIFTGSQIPLGVLRTDGRENLITAIEIAVSKLSGRARVPEVCIYFQNKLLRANRTTKYSAEQLDAFRSPNYPALAEVGVHIQYNTSFIRHKQESRALQIHTSLESHIIVLRIFPGMHPDLLRETLDMKGLRAVVLQTYGSGNAPTDAWFIDPLAEAIERGMVVMNVSQCPDGGVSMDLYETGKRLKEIGVLDGKDITVESALTKLIVFLGVSVFNKDSIGALAEDMRGEISG